MAPTASPESAYTLGQLEHAIQQAHQAEAARDIGVFGENKQKKGEFESIAKLTAKHFQEKLDDFVLPQVRLVCQTKCKTRGRNEITKSFLEVDGEVICPDFEKFILNEEKVYKRG